MAQLSVLLANEPRSYRDTIGMALGLLRPHIEVIVADPETLDEAIQLHAPQMVICSYLTSVVETQVPTWVLLYPDGAMGALIHLRGARTAMSEVDLEGIVRLIDQTNHLDHAPM